ncbi:MAG: DUF4330 family protein [Cyanobacteria bacterium REEB65]|nr:DUF4330 family protein [Cyanobacteria bacterium REEB65]
MIDSEGRLFGRINILDVVLVVVLAGILGGFGLAKAGRAGIHAHVKGTAIAEVDCYIRGAIEDPASLIKPGDKTFVTLRNVPYSAVEVIAVKVSPKLVAVPQPDGSLKAMPDPAEPLSQDVLVTIRDRAHLTDDGIVFGDSKVKVGTPIDLEGYRYRLHGAIVDVRTVPASGSSVQ